MTDRNGATQVLVIGGGLAGLATALRAAEHGLSVTVLEASVDELYLCNTRYTGGVFHIAMDNMRGDPAVSAQNIARVTDGEMDGALAKTLTQNAHRTLDWLQRQGVTIIKAGVDGLRQNALAPPGVKRTGLHWRGRSGDVLLRTLADRYLKLGGRFERGCEAQSLIMRDGGCCGAIVQRLGKRVEMHAEAVVLADGGFQADMELVGEHISPAPEKLLMRNAKTGKGSGLRMAKAVGAALVGLESFYGHIQYREAMTDQRFWPYPVLDSLATAGILVDGEGQRFCDEGLGGVYATNAIAKLPDPLSAHIIFDDAIWKGPGKDWLLPANPYLITAGGMLTTANSIDELATQIGLVPADLKTTIQNYNAGLAGGEKHSIQRSTGNIKAWPIEKGPFHALPICAGVTYTMGGILTDTQARVLDGNDRPIAGLLAVGATTGGLEGGSLSGYSGGLSKSSVFGMIAGDTLRDLLSPKNTQISKSSI